MKYFITFIILMATVCLKAQVAEDSLKKTVSLNEAVVSANKTEEMKRHIASQIQVFNAKQIQFSNVQTTADVIALSGQVMVQKSQQGGGSPVIRGFEASRVLMVIDGVRMNNLIYRSGHLQNIVTIDPSMLEKVEIFFGPSSTIYGSDALGGTMHFLTRNPRVKSDEFNGFALNALQRYSSVNNGLSSHINLNLGFRKIASLTAISYNSFGDLKMGKSINPFYDTLFGLRPVYAQRINGIDSAIASSNKYLQKQSGYKQIDLMQKFLFVKNKNVEHSLNFQISNSGDVPRYDRLSEISNGAPTFAVWNYGPQKRFMSAYDLNVTNKLGFNKIHLGVSYQKIQESRISRRFKRSNLDTRTEDVDVLGYNLDFQKNLKKDKLRFGFDGQANRLKSSAYRININTNVKLALDTRYPDGDNTLNHNALYFTHTRFVNKKFTINDGARIGFSKLSSEIINNSFFKLPVTSVQQNNFTYSGYLGIIYNPIDKLKLFYQASTGYRVPNIDDLSKIFETTAGNVIVPNPGLKPEQTITNELGFGYTPKKNIRIEGSFWHTFFQNAITTNVSQFNGLDSVFYDGKMNRVYSNLNSKKAIIYGFSTSVIADISSHSQAYFNYSYTKGSVTSEDIAQPLDHIAPMLGNLGYMLTLKKLTTEVNLQFSGKKNISDYSNSGEDNLNYAPKGGMPAWSILNLKMAYKITRNFTAQAGIDNILDTNYRVFASGINGPGRNFFIALRLKM